MYYVAQCTSVLVVDFDFKNIESTEIRFRDKGQNAVECTIKDMKTLKEEKQSP